MIDSLEDGPKRRSRAPKRAPRQPQEGPRTFQHVPKRALRWPQEAYKTLAERTIAKVLILTPIAVVVGFVVVVVVVVVAHHDGPKNLTRLSKTEQSQKS